MQIFQISEVIMKKKNNDREYPCDTYQDILEESDEDLFEIGQVYDNDPAKKLVCKLCGNDKFYIGKGDYFTALKCPTCLYEICVHDG